MVLVTGGLGYLGARISNHLIKNNHKVRITSSRKNPNIPTELSSCEVVQIDLTDSNSIDNACKDIDSIIHLASLNYTECKGNPKKAELVNSVGTLKLLNSAKKNTIRTFLYFSTAHVYGADLKGVIDENSPLMPASHYALSHKEAEDYVNGFNKNEQFKGYVLRLTNVVGSPLDQSANCWMLIANDLCKKIAMNQEPKLHANKLIRRDFIAITDVISAVNKVIIDPNLVGERKIMNFSSGNSSTLEDLCNLIEERALIKLNKKIRIIKNDINQDFLSKDFRISNAKALACGLSFNNSLSDEIDSMLLNFDNWFS
jgi:UDP-glucose 4-epimerase